MAYLWIQEKCEQGRVTLKDISTEEQLGDIFTKNLSRGRFEYLKSRMLRLHASEEEHAADSVPAHAELSEHSEIMFENN